MTKPLQDPSPLGGALHGEPDLRLPAPPNRLIDREEAVATVQELLRGKARLVTLTGTGGTGKTRLALEVAGRLGKFFRGNGAFVPLAGLEDHDLLPAAIAQALGLREVGGEAAVETVKAAVGSSRALFVLDNFEHLGATAPLLGELLSSCPGLRLLVTSRSPLRISGEWVYDLAPLEPEVAIELFVERASAANRSFTLTATNEAAVTAICTRLEGLPLALELAAARVNVLPLAVVLDGLESRLTFLTLGARDLPTRQRTLRATIDWSYRLLGQSDQELFVRVAAFGGTFTLEAAEAVCGSGELPLVDRLTALIDSSLLRRVGGRYAMLETIREYALERLDERGEADEVRRRHANFFLALAEQAEAELAQGAAQAQWDAQLTDDLENFRTALSWLNERREAEPELRLAAALARFWRVHCYLREGSRQLERALAASVEVGADLRAKALGAAGGFAFIQGRYDEARRLVEEGLELSRELQDETLEGRFLTELAVIAGAERRLDDAATMLEQAIDVFRRTGHRPLRAAATHNLGYLALGRGDLERAQSLCGESLELFRALDDEQGVAVSLHALGVAALLDGREQEALAHFRESLTLAHERGFTIGIVCGLEGMAAALAATDHPRPAAVLLGSADRIRAEEEAVAEPVEASVRDRALAAALERLGDKSLEAYEREGATLSLTDSVTYALEEAEAPGRRVTKTFLFTDIVRSTQLAEAVGDEAWAELVRWHDRTLRHLFAAHGGEEVDHAGDGFFAAFDDPGSALECAVAIQRELAAHRAAHGFAPPVRVGVHAASAVFSKGAYRGLGVHRAARIAALAEGGEIVASTETVELAPRFRMSGTQAIQLRGSRELVRVSAVEWRDLR